MQPPDTNQLTMPRILQEKADGDNVSIDFAIDEQLSWFRGHFPGYPVLPGVVQLHWAAKIASERFGVSAAPHEVLKLKFKGVVIPPIVINMRLSRIAVNEVQFQFSTIDQQYSLGRLRYSGNEQ